MASQRDQNSSVAHNKKVIFQHHWARASESKAAGGEYMKTRNFYLFPFYYLSHIIMIISNAICCVFAFAFDRSVAKGNPFISGE